MRKTKLFLFISLIFILSSLIVQGQDTAVLRVATTADPSTWDPSLSFGVEALYIANLYEPLLWVNPPDAEEAFTPALAESWSVSDDGTVWTFNIRQGVKFHDGSDLTADVVKRSIERNSTTGGASFVWWPLASVEAVDDFTVEITTSVPAAVDLIASSLYSAWIISPEALDAAEAYEGEGSVFDAEMIDGGSGPYMLSEFNSGESVIMAQFGDYWGGWDDNQFKNIFFQIVSDAVVQENLLLGGEIDIALRLPPTSYDSFVENADFTVNDEDTVFNYVGFLNVLRPPLDNKLIRQAISYAIPYDDVIAVGAEGRATQARGPVPAGVFPYSDDVPQYTYDMEKAKALIAESGIDVSGVELRLTYSAENIIEKSFAPLIKDSLEELGFSVTIEGVLFTQQWEDAKSDPANAQDIFLLLYWPTYSDAGSDNLASMFHSNEPPFFNLSYYNNPEFDELVDTAVAQTASDRAAAQANYIEALTMLVDDAPGLFFMDVGDWFAIPNYIEGFDYNLNYAFAHFFYPLHLAQ